MKNIIYIISFFCNFRYDDNFDLEISFINTIIKDFNHWSYCFIIKIAKTMNISRKHLKRCYISEKRKKKYEVLKK